MIASRRSGDGPQVILSPHDLVREVSDFAGPCSGLKRRCESANRSGRGSTGIGNCEVGDPDLDPLMTAPTVDAQGAGHVDVAAHGAGEGLTERLARGTERDGADDGAVARAQLHANVAAGSDLAHLDEPVVRKSEDRLRLARSE